MLSTAPDWRMRQPTQIIDIAVQHLLCQFSPKIKPQPCNFTPHHVSAFIVFASSMEEMKVDCQRGHHFVVQSSQVHLDHAYGCLHHP